MEFQFHDVDDRKPPTPPPPQMPVDFIPPPSNFARYSLSGSPTRLPPRGRGGGGDRRWFPVPGPMPCPNDGWDHEMERIRVEEIILCEIARCREIELEVRRDIVLLEREMVARRAGLFFDDDRFCTMPYNPGPSQAPAHSFEERWRSGPGPVQPRSFSSRWYEFSSRLSPLELYSELNASPEPDKDKLIVLAKPNPNICVTKRKAVEPPAAANGETCPFGLKKKPKDEWSCALCKVTTTSEKLLNDHLQGKKHVAKEEKLKAAEIPTKSLVPKKTECCTPNSKLKAKAEGASLEESGTVGMSKTNNNDSQDLKSKGEPVPKKDEIAQDLKLAAGSETVQQAVKAKERKKENFEFWCEMCQVGSLCLQVMEDHKKGKKHMGRLQKQKKSDQAASETTRISQEITIQKPEDSLVQEPNIRDKTSSKTTPMSLEVIDSKSEVPKIACKPLKAVIVPKPEKT